MIPSTNTNTPFTPLPIETISHVHCESDDKDATLETTKMFAKHIPYYKDLKEIQLQYDDCIIDGYLHMVPSDLKGKAAVKGKDGHGRVFVAYATESKKKRVTCVNVIFQRYVGCTDIVSTCYTRGYVLGHDQLFSATPDLEVAKETINALYRGKHPNWKL